MACRYAHCLSLIILLRTFHSTFYAMADGVVLEFYVSEVLCFCKYYFGKVPKGEIVDVLVGFYDDKEIEKAKETLFNCRQGAVAED